MTLPGMIRLPKPIQTTLVVMAALAAGYGAATWRAQPVVSPRRGRGHEACRSTSCTACSTRWPSACARNTWTTSSPTKLEEAAIVGMVSSLDPHSALLDADAYDEMRINTAGSYTGLGIEIAADQDRIVVVTPIEGSPAATGRRALGRRDPVDRRATRQRGCARSDPRAHARAAPDRACGSRSAASASRSRCSSTSSAPRFTCAR